MQLSELRTAVRTRLGVPSTDGFYTDAQLTDLVNEALQVISTERDWPWLSTSETITTVSGTATDSPPAGWMKTRSLCIDGYDPMEQRSLLEIRGVPTTDRGMPTIYDISGDVLIFRPVPDGVYSIIHDYFKVEPSLTADADTPLMPTQFHYSIVAKASELAHLRQRDNTRAGAQLAEYNAWLGRMLDNRRRTSAPTRIRVRPGAAI